MNNIIWKKSEVKVWFLWLVPTVWLEALLSGRYVYTDTNTKVGFAELSLSKKIKFSVRSIPLIVLSLLSVYRCFQANHWGDRILMGLAALYFLELLILPFGTRR
jgi:hypothetical protein